MSRGKQLNGKITGEQEILSREQTLQILSEMARAGSVSSSSPAVSFHRHLVAIERELGLAEKLVWPA